MNNEGLLLSLPDKVDELIQVKAQIKELQAREKKLSSAVKVALMVNGLTEATGEAGKVSIASYSRYSKRSDVRWDEVPKKFIKPTLDTKLLNASLRGRAVRWEEFAEATEVVSLRVSGG